MLIDTHAHLDFEQFSDDFADVLDRARSAGLVHIIDPGVDVASSRAAVALSEQHEMISATVGIHPNNVSDADPGDIFEIAALARHPKVVAIGEIGLDFYRDRTSPEMQVRAFRGQLDLARDLDLPVVIHFREVGYDGIELVGRDAFDGIRGVFHFFSGSWDFAKAVLDMGFYLGFDGPLTYKNYERGDVAQRVPLDRCLLETDAPYLAPQKYRGKRNEPSYVVEVAAKLAEIKGIDVDEVTSVTSRNAQRLFQIGG